MNKFFQSESNECKIPIALYPDQHWVFLMFYILAIPIDK